MPYPKITIVFCLRCKWNLRSAWYLQELLQTFGEELGEVSLVPGPVGTFKVLGYKNSSNEESEIVIWDRSLDGGFPDSKYLKQRVKEMLFDNSVSIGSHIERKTVAGELLVAKKQADSNNSNTEDDASNDQKECVDCC